MLEHKHLSDIFMLSIGNISKSIHSEDISEVIIETGRNWSAPDRLVRAEKRKHTAPLA